MLADNVMAPNYVDGTVQFGVPYYYKVTASNEAGTSDFSNEVVASAHTLAQAARRTWEREAPFAPETLVAASLGPYGAMLAEGQEYTGDYGDADAATLERFHHDRVAALLGPAPDLLAWETIPNIVEAEVIAALQERFAGPEAWVAFQCADGGRIADGTPIEFSDDQWRGDAIVLEGPSRNWFHGVDRILPGTSRLLDEGGRFNLTLRRVTQVGRKF